MSNQFRDPDIYGDPEPCDCCDNCDGLVGECNHEICSECEECLGGSCRCEKCHECDKSIYDCLCKCDVCQAYLTACECHRCHDCTQLQADCRCSMFECRQCKGACRVLSFRPAPVESPPSMSSNREPGAADSPF